jgi:hypothetical protein
MLLQGRSFDGSSSLGAASCHLEAIAGSARWITVYQPVPYAGRRLIETLLNILWGHDICCAIAGQFGTYTAGISSSYLHVAVYRAFRTSSLGQSVPTRAYPIFHRPFRIHAHGQHHIRPAFLYCNAWWQFPATNGLPVRNRTMILYVEHHRARNEGWQSTALCAPCARLRRDDWYFW